MENLYQIFSYWHSGGLLLLPIALVSAGIWACFIRSRSVLLRTMREGDILMQGIEKNGLTSDAETMIASIQQYAGGIAEMMYLALRDVSNGAHPLNAFEQREAEGVRLLKRDFLILAALTAVAPLLGLLGTVMGMIETFDAVATVGGDTGGRVAAGISRALITTQFGLVVALPGVFGLARLQRMLSNTQVMMAEARVHLVAKLEGLGDW